MQTLLFRKRDGALNEALVDMLVLSKRRRQNPATRIFSYACVPGSSLNIVPTLQKNFSASRDVLQFSSQALRLGLRSGYHGPW